VMQGLTKLAPFVGILSLIIAWLIYNYVKKQPNGNALMADLEEQIHIGAMTFLKREYTVLIVFIGIVFILLGWGVAWKTAIFLHYRCLVLHVGRFFGNDRRDPGKFSNCRGRQ
jgi:K(+)-stimulated pyrophosphate-energized sodium pump